MINKTRFKYRQANTSSSSVLLIYKLERELNCSESGKCDRVKRHVYSRTVVSVS